MRGLGSVEPKALSFFSVLENWPKGWSGLSCQGQMRSCQSGIPWHNMLSAMMQTLKRYELFLMGSIYEVL